MPRRSRHDETGMLLRDANGLLLVRDDGGRWRLEADPAVSEYLGCRVRITGTRTGFDVLSVEAIGLC